MSTKIKRVSLLVGLLAIVCTIVWIISFNFQFSQQFSQKADKMPDLRYYSAVCLTFDSVDGYIKCDILYDTNDPSYGLGLVITNETDIAIEVGQTGKLYFEDSTDNTFSEVESFCDDIDTINLLGLFLIEPGQSRDSFYIPNMECESLKSGSYRMVFVGNWVDGSKGGEDNIKLNVDFRI